MARTVADEVYARVEALTSGRRAVSRAEAIRRVAAEMGKTVSATSSAFYSGARRARRDAAPPPEPAPAEEQRRRSHTAGHPDAPTLYAEMLPLVEAGATVAQAARRFGDEDAVPEIAAGFSRWREREQERGDLGEARAGAAEVSERANELERRLRDLEARIVSLEAENRELSRGLSQARQAIGRARAILDAAG